MKIAPGTVLRRVSRPVGFVLYGLAGAIALCGLAGSLFQATGYVRPDIDEGSVFNLFLSAAITAGAGFLLHRTGAPVDVAALTRRDAFVLTAAIWLAASVFGALPYVLDTGMTPADALFESTSGFTTTGATVVNRIEATLSRPLLLWRSLTQWMGGMGIVVLFVAFFPRVGAGGKKLFKAEVPGPTAGGLAPRIAETALWLYGMYVALTLVEAGLLTALGMPLFEAICHAFTTVSTGGFSTRDASVAAFQSPAIEVVIAVFMLAAGVNFGLYYGVLRTRRIGLFLRSPEFRAYAGIVLTVIFFFTVLNRTFTEGEDVVRSWLDSARHALFTTATFITSTGYGIEDYMQFPAPSLALVLLLMFIGGCAGSTAGGMKISRVILTMETIGTQIRRAVRPNVVQVVRMEGQAVDEALLLEVSAFLCLYLASLGVGTWLVALTDGVPIGTAFGATLTCVSNMGPAPFHGGVDTFAVYSDTAKLLFSYAMVLGRLEFMTLLALVLPAVWEK
ncbi:MAG: TrkH family potassium uptake protein [Myxococcota bacterium]